LERGFLISVDGVEGSGRTLHVESLKKWLEEMGYGVTTVGIQMSKLMSEPLSEVKRNIVFQRFTLFLAYATDLADQVENVIKPSIKSGFIVIADGYINTLKSWALTRKLSQEWVNNVLSITPKPDVSISLISPPSVIIRRIIRKRGFLDPLTSAVDLCINEDLYRSFSRYVNKFQSNLTALTEMDGGSVFNTNKSLDQSTKEITYYVEGYLKR
jgi:dTMP kinase